MKVLSVCSGMEAASVAWAPLGWEPVAFSEIDKHASAVLAHHYPHVPNWGDMTKFRDWPDAVVDVLVGGTPCQSFSVAGLRKGLDDPRGALMLVFGAIARRYRPRWIVWENVPGVLSADEGRAFGAFLGMLGELGYGFAYRVLDAQYFGLAQRRARVFVVGYTGDWRPPAAVLFERESLRGDSAPRREAGEGVAPTVAGGARASGGYSHDDVPLVSPALKARDYKGPSSDGDGDGAPLVVTHALRGEGFDASEDGTGRGTPLVPHAFYSTEGRFDNLPPANIAPPLKVGSNGGGQAPAIAFSSKDHSADAGEIAPTLRAMSHDGSHANAGGQLAVAFAATNMVKETHADAPQTGPVEALRALRDAVGEEAFSQWGLGILASLLPAEVLRSAVHGRCIRRPAEPKHGLVNIALSRSQAGAAWSVRDLWQAGCDGCPPQGWRPHEQLARELGAHLSKLPYSSSSAQGFMRDLRRAGEGSRLLREALSAVEEAWRSAGGEGQSASTSAAVRRLTADECEILQGFPRQYTLVPWKRGKMPDGPRYKMLGNSMAVPVMRWIGARIDLVNALFIAQALTATIEANTMKEMRMETKFTPGPWQSQHEFDLNGVCTIIGNVDGPDDGRYHYTTICDVDEAPDEYLANVSLIAAAPCVFDAASALVDADVAYDGNRIVIQCASHSDAIARVSRLRAALTLARGESTP